MSNEELLALSSCPPPQTVADEIDAIDSATERIALQHQALEGPVTYVINLCCEEMVAIGTALKKIERHLGRLVNKELKGTGVALAQIANFLQIIALTNVGEQQTLLTQLQQQLLFGPPAPAIEPFAQAPEPSLTPEIEGSFTGQGEIITPPPAEELILPPSTLPAIADETPSFVPEVSAAVGGETIPLPQPGALLSKPLGFPLNPDFIHPEEVAT